TATENIKNSGILQITMDVYVITTTQYICSSGHVDKKICRLAESPQCWLVAILDLDVRGEPGEEVKNANAYTNMQVFKNNLPFIFTLLCCYVAFIVVPALLFTLYLFSKDETPHRKPLPRRRSNEGLNNNTTNTNIDNNNLDAPQTELNPLFATSPQDSAPTGSQSESCISNKAPAYSGNRPHEEQQRALAQPNEPLAVQQVNERDSQNEESPEISSIESADSVTLLWNLGSEICQEPTLRKNCVIVGSGLLLAIMIYRLARK
ncbi:hypothetical protein ACROYT_G002540, partial [Oculina patagonica]